MHRTADEIQPLSTTAEAPDFSRSLPPTTPPHPTRSYFHLIALLLITAIGGCFRFYRLTYPPLWNDESLVFWRVCGTYGQMLEPLRHDMFPPLHYSLYWLIGHYHKLTPWVMRLIPAVAGTLSIPAIYFLSRQMVSRGTSLLAAAFTACSAFMLFYSRDAKMYPTLWLFTALNIASLLWWFRSKTSTAWLCWVACGCAMTGLHFTAMVIPVLSLFYLLTQHRLHWKQVLLFLLGTALILAGPVGFFTKFNPVANRLETEGWKATRLYWVGPFYNGNRTGPQLVQVAASAMMTGYEWPRDDYVPSDPQDAAEPISPPLVECPQIATNEIFFILAIGLIPWPLFLRPRRDPATEPPWRILLWIGGWILFVGYGFYIPSMQGFISPRGWIYQLKDWLPAWSLPIMLGGLITFILVTLSRRRFHSTLIRFVQTSVSLAGLYAGCTIIFMVMFNIVTERALANRPIGSVWSPRYLAIVWPAVAIATAVLLMRLPTRAVRIACIFFVLAVNLAMGSLRLLLTTEPPIDRLADDIWLSQDPKSTQRTFDFIQVGDIAGAGSNMNTDDPEVSSGRYYLQMLSNHQPMSPDLFRASLSLYNRHTTYRYRAVQQSVDSSLQLQHVIIWSQLFQHDTNGKPQQLTYDPFRKALPNWKLADEQVYTVRIYWDWRERWRWVRREYVRRNADR